MSHTYSTETLYHFNCMNCNKWWSIGDHQLKVDGEISCPHCGTNSNYKEEKECEPDNLTIAYMAGIERGKDIIRAKIEKQEPVGWYNHTSCGDDHEFYYSARKDIVLSGGEKLHKQLPLYTHPAPPTSDYKEVKECDQE